MGTVVTATDLAAIGAAVGTFLTGAGGVIAALRSPGRQPDPGPARPGDWPMVSVRLVRIRRAETFASWSLGLGVSAWVLAIGAVALAGLTAVALNSVPIHVLEWGAITLAGCTVGAGALNLHQSIASQCGPVRQWRAGAGLVVSIGALAAILIAGS
jgi:hypothetical protein